MGFSMINNSEDLQGQDVHRFTHYDNEAEVHLLNLDEAHTIQDSLNNTNNQSPQEGYVNMPDRLPLGVVLGIIVQFLVLTVGGTSYYTSMKAEQVALKEQLSRIETNMYSKSEALLRLEIQKAELEAIRTQLNSKGKSNHETN